jgi:hypothetical protein
MQDDHTTLDRRTALNVLHLQTSKISEQFAVFIPAHFKRPRLTACQHCWYRRFVTDYKNARSWHGAIDRQNIQESLTAGAANAEAFTDFASRPE